MANSFSTDILIQTEGPKSAVSFYVEQLGFGITEELPHMISLHGQNINLFMSGVQRWGRCLKSLSRVLKKPDSGC